MAGEERGAHHEGHEQQRRKRKQAPERDPERDSGKERQPQEHEAHRLGGGQAPAVGGGGEDGREPGMLEPAQQEEERSAEDEEEKPARREQEGEERLRIDDGTAGESRPDHRGDWQEEETLGEPEAQRETGERAPAAERRQPRRLSQAPVSGDRSRPPGWPCRGWPS